MVHLLSFIHDCRNQVWEHGENLFPGFKCKYCVKEFCGGGATRLKEHLAEKSGNVTRCTYMSGGGHQTYGTTSYMSCKGFESERRL
jgi:hypothetical protein